MCGRYAESVTANGIEEFFEIAIGPSPEIVPRYNVAPTQRAPVVALDAQGARALRLHRWGLVPKWATDPKVGARAINARADTVATNPMFRRAYRSRRCLVPATGFYEWQKTADGKVPHFIHPARDPLFAFAGLWEAWTPPDGVGSLRTFTILTVAPNDLMASIHDRMPVILPKRAWAEWLDPATPAGDLGALLASYPGAQMRAHVVSTMVNRVRNDSPALVEPVRDSRAA